MLTVTCVLVGAAFIVTILSAIGKAPLWVAVLLMVIVEMLRFMPR